MLGLKNKLSLLQMLFGYTKFGLKQKNQWKFDYNTYFFQPKPIYSEWHTDNIAYEITRPLIERTFVAFEKIQH